ncbi:hypothetical protein [Martelella radicis]|uniref:Uncharacterized protein n=1 Tax=Martelella radicis TaxID=1397476 RepID=A0A7W6PCI4_9HYPH|nr:hypothetical protein [Martelella radicis]MBB4123447.1 hypothetical protein [Martelella radicis]
MSEGAAPTLGLMLPRLLAASPACGATAAPPLTVEAGFAPMKPRDRRAGVASFGLLFMLCCQW